MRTSGKVVFNLQVVKTSVADLDPMDLHHVGPDSALINLFKKNLMKSFL